MSAADFSVREPAPWQAYLDRAHEARIPFQSCAQCGHAIFYPRVLCPACGATELEWRDASGAGVVYSQTHLPSRDGTGRQILLVDMVEGFRVMGVSDVPGLAIGDSVRTSLVTDEQDRDAEPRYIFSREGTDG